nr:MAG TPA: hypothetical protein [Caudoviricetes sp.]
MCTLHRVNLEKEIMLQYHKAVMYLLLMNMYLK